MRARRRETPAERRERHAEVGDLDRVVDAAARLLETRPRSEAEVRRRLIAAGYQAGLVDDAVNRLVQLGYLDDEAFARTWVESRDRAHPRGERALRSELMAKGIDRAVVDSVLTERGGQPAIASSLEAPDLSAARRLLDRRRRSLLREADPLKRRQKAYALLARNGFDPEVSRTVAAAFEVVEVAGDDVEDEGLTEA